MQDGQTTPSSVNCHCRQKDGGRNRMQKIGTEDIRRRWRKKVAKDKDLQKQNTERLPRIGAIPERDG